MSEAKPYLNIDPERQPTIAEEKNVEILGEIIAKFEKEIPGITKLGTKLVFRDKQAVDDVANQELFPKSHVEKNPEHQG